VKQAESLSPDGRNLLSVAFTMLGGVCIVSGHALAENTGWIGWLAALILFEPVGILSLAAALFVNYPRSRASLWFAKAYSHARPGLLILTVLMTVGVVGSIAFFLLQALFDL
jgi:hypothetical protein